MSAPSILVPYDRREAISVTEAAVIAGRSDDTVRRWAALHDLGRRIGGRWIVSRIALAMFLDGDHPALEAFLVGDRTSAMVAGYVVAVDNENKVAAKTANAADAA